MSWLFWEIADARESLKTKWSYPFVREIYIYNGNLHFQGCLPLYQKEKDYFNHKRILSMEKMQIYIYIPNFILIYPAFLGLLFITGLPPHLLFLLSLAEDGVLARVLSHVGELLIFLWVSHIHTWGIHVNKFVSFFLVFYYWDLSQELRRVKGNYFFSPTHILEKFLNLKVKENILIQFIKKKRFF